jgi:alpha-amylase
MKNLLFSLIVITSCFSFQAQVNPTNRQIVLQGFWWDYWNSNYPNGWANYLAELAPRLKDMGIDAVWIPPTIKNGGTNSVGYSPFDHYDLGDKWQKGNVKTRVGDKDELLRMVAVMKANGIDVIQDIVLNHNTNAGSANGAGGADPAAIDDGSTSKFKNFRYTSYKTPGTTETATNYLARGGRFHKNWQNFYPNNNNVCCTNEINSPYWGPDISYESNAFGLSGNATYNPAQTENYMRNGMRNWFIWYKKQVGWDGVRLDAVKHFPNYVTEDYLWNLQNNAGWASGGEGMFAVGEWVGGQAELDNWANAVQNRAGTFDFALRGALNGIVSGNSFYNMGAIPAAQQQNRGRTVPFVNNHDTFRPQLSSSGNYTGWNTGQQLGQHIEPNDGRNSAAHAVVLAVDGAPQIFFEDLFNIGYLGNRFSHDPKNEEQLPVRSDIENLIWCHQNLRFKEGAYLVRWQAEDALVIERGGKALIGITDSWTNWQNLTGVQTSWNDGTILVDYSGANGTAERTVYGGGKVDISIPPCDGTAAAGRRCYSVWAPKGITANYERPAKTITQEWEMDDDLGDSEARSLQQGGRLPANSRECRTVGKVFAKNGTQISLELYPAAPTHSITMILLDKDCNPIDSIVGAGNLVFNKNASYDGWYTIRIRNTTASQPGQKCWVKATYMAPAVVQTNVHKAKCACVAPPTSSITELSEELSIYPNPVTNSLNIDAPANIENWQLMDMNGKILASGKAADYFVQIDMSEMAEGAYIFTAEYKGFVVRRKVVKAGK